VPIVSGFTLLEVLVSLSITGVLLAGVGLVLHEVSQELVRIHQVDPQMQYVRALDVIGADIEGAIGMEPIAADAAGNGLALAEYLTTHRLNPLQNDQWTGSVRVRLWLKESDDHRKLLWRQEMLRCDPEQTEPSWACLVGDLVDIQIDLFQNEQWRSWPATDEKGEAIEAEAVRISAVAACGEKDIVTLPTSVFSVGSGSVHDAASHKERKTH
jgi:prepilin-type N-terminal cleavage/methylation domain-containing protein